YFRRLVGLARKKLRAAPRRAADEEDVALSAFDSFCRGAEQDRFPQLHDRLDLWQLLVLLTARKAVDLAQPERRQNRGGAVRPHRRPPPPPRRPVRPGRGPGTDRRPGAAARLRRPGGRGVPPPARAPGQPRAAHRRPAQGGGLRQRGDRRPARLRPAHRRAPAPPDPQHLGAGRGVMNGSPRAENAALPLPLARQVEAAYQRFESAWRAGQRPLIEDPLGSLPGAARAVLLPELLELELSCRRRAGESVRPEEYRQRFPEHAALIESLIREEARGVAGVASAAQDLAVGVAT